MLPELHKQLRLDFMSCSIHVSTGREVDMLIKTAGLACEPKLDPPIHKAAYKPVICLVLVSYKHDYSASCINKSYSFYLQLPDNDDGDGVLS